MKSNSFIQKSQSSSQECGIIGTDFFSPYKPDLFHMALYGKETPLQGSSGAESKI